MTNERKRVRVQDEWTDLAAVARGKGVNGYIYVKPKEGEDNETAIKRVSVEHPEITSWEKKPVDPATPQSHAPRRAGEGRMGRRGAILLNKEEMIAMKRAAAANPSDHTGLTYTDDPAEAAARGYVVAVAPRRKDEILDPSVMVLEAADVKDARSQFGRMTDEAVKSSMGHPSSAGLADSMRRYMGGA